MQVLLAQLVQAGYPRIEPAILQDASHFLDLGGEDIRASLYFTSDRGGAELCLRPEFTIPVCRAYLDSRRGGEAASFSYCGPVFRFRAGEPDEFIQAGLESFGRTDAAAADAEILGLALEAATGAGAPSLATTFGDAGLLAQLLDALKLPPTWQRRLKRGLDKGETPSVILAAAPTQSGDHAGVLAALAGTDATGARALVDDLLSIAGITSVGGRSATEIAERFLSQVAMRSAPPFGEEQRAVLDRFLAIAGHPDEAATDLRRLAAEAGLDLGTALDLFEERISFMAVHGVDLATVSFSGSFGRKLDYYTGFVFECRNPTASIGPVVGGGRYDRLAQSLGSKVAVPAVGAAIWVDRLHGGELAS
ncbi:ATP phosphoribosyltransferase regulatory subunit [Lichenifustis flavocetrariae]